jgi:AMMECR1 domain-containing protein
VSLGKSRGLLLPQVATDHHLAVEEFLEETCRKAQLDRNAWQEAQTKVFGFTCEVFSEEENLAER